MGVCEIKDRIRTQRCIMNFSQVFFRFEPFFVKKLINCYEFFTVSLSGAFIRVNDIDELHCAKMT